MKTWNRTLCFLGWNIAPWRVSSLPKGLLLYHCETNCVFYLKRIQTKTKRAQRRTLHRRVICVRTTWACDGQTDLVQHFGLSYYSIQHPTLWGSGCTECWDSKKKPFRRKAAVRIWEHPDRLMLLITLGMRLEWSQYVELISKSST